MVEGDSVIQLVVTKKNIPESKEQRRSCCFFMVSFGFRKVFFFGGSVDVWIEVLVYILDL